MLDHLNYTVHGQGTLVVLGAVCVYKIQMHASNKLLDNLSVVGFANIWHSGLIFCCFQAFPDHVCQIWIFQSGCDPFFVVQLLVHSLLSRMCSWCDRNVHLR